MDFAPRFGAFQTENKLGRKRIMAKTNDVYKRLKSYEPLWECWYLADNKMLGMGSSGQVYLIKDEIIKDNIKYAVVKVISQELGPEWKNRTQEERKNALDLRKNRLFEEIRHMRKLEKRPYLVHCLDYAAKYYYDNEGMPVGFDVLIRMERYTCLSEVMWEDVMRTDEIEKLARQIGTALYYMHEIRMLHRDIKPGNIYIDEDTGDFLLGDFGISKQAAPNNYMTYAGTREYMAPEVFRSESSIDSYTFTADIYSYGLVLYYLLNEYKLPFMETRNLNNDDEAQQLRLNGAKFPEPKNGSAVLKSVVMKCCEFKPEDRYQSISEVLEDLGCKPPHGDDKGGAFSDSHGAISSSRKKAVHSAGSAEAYDDNTVPKKKRNPAIAATVGVVLVLVLIIAGLSTALTGSLSKEKPSANNADYSNAADDNMQDESNVTTQSSIDNDNTSVPDDDSPGKESSKPDNKPDDVHTENQYIYLTDLTGSGSSDGNGLVYYTAAVDNLGTRYSNGMGGSATEQSWQEYKLDGKYTELRGRAILNYECRTQSNDNIYLWIYGDDKQLYKSEEIKGGVLPQDFTVDITGVETLRIVIDGQNMVRLVDCALYKDSSVQTVSTAKEIEDDKRTQVSLYDLDRFNSSNANGTYDYEPNAKDRNGNTYSGAFIGPIFGKGDWQDYYIGGKYSEISGVLARTNAARSGDIFDSDPAQMRIYGDGTLLYETNIYNESEAISFNVDITGIQVLRIYTVESGHFMIADCVLTK